eukprot:4128700-Alexandrium_andersonii.AAC.1
MHVLTTTRAEPGCHGAGFGASAAESCGARAVSLRRGAAGLEQQLAPVCACVCACVRACVRACARAR